MERPFSVSCPPPRRPSRPGSLIYPRRGIAKSKWARIETLLRNRSFQEKYREAIKRYLGGITNVLFPFGTYWMNKFGKVACETADLPASPGIAGLLPAPA